MNITNRQALEAVETLKRFCEGKDCTECPFYARTRCRLGVGEDPLAWSIPARWTKRDKALAEALKLAGIESVRRTSLHGTLILIGEGRKTVPDAGGMLHAFCDLEAGEEITLDEIIKE